MFHPPCKINYQSPANIDSFDVGISYKSELDEDLVFLYNDSNQNSEVQLPLDDQGKCVYKIYLKNNSSRLCEVKIFIANSPNEYSITGEHSNHLILKPDIPYYIERPDNVYRKYTFVSEESKIFKEIVDATEDDFNSYITVQVYPEKRWCNQLSTLGMHHEFKGIKVETDFGGHRTKNRFSFGTAGEGLTNPPKSDHFGSACFGTVDTGPTIPSATDCFGSALADPSKSGVNSKYNISKGDKPSTVGVTVGGATVLGEKSTQVFYRAPLITKEGSCFTYNFKLTGLVKHKFIPLNPTFI